jgi:hypothetical protein
VVAQSRGAVLLGVILALGAGNAAAGVSLGAVHGTVLRGPITPVCRVSVPCDAPAAALVLTFTGAGVVRRVTSDARGRYRIVLPEGIFSVRTSAKPFGQTPRPASIRIRAGQNGRVDFTIDTGIR